jgi:uncharacterized membrane protein YphA (DoxX/SURF4 family)
MRWACAMVSGMLVGTTFAINEFQSYEVDKSIKLPTASKVAHEAWKD